MVTQRQLDLLVGHLRIKNVENEWQKGYNEGLEALKDVIETGFLLERMEAGK